MQKHTAVQTAVHPKTLIIADAATEQRILK